MVHWVEKPSSAFAGRTGGRGGSVSPPFPSLVQAEWRAGAQEMMVHPLGHCLEDTEGKKTFLRDRKVAGPMA